MPTRPATRSARIDWKILARTDKYFVKLFEDETNLRAYILLDCSKSMAFQSGKLSKLEYGCYLAAALTHLMLRQNDAVGLVLFDDRDPPVSCRPRPGRRSSAACWKCWRRRRREATPTSERCCTRWPSASGAAAWSSSSAI